MRRLLAAVCFAAPLLLAAGAQAQTLDCRRAHWMGRDPAVNVGHIFCGEIKRRPDGYHSEAIQPTPLVNGVADRQPIGRGLYNGTVLFADGERKFSTFYPRACSIGQIVASIRFAASQPPRPKRNGWGFVAPSAPDDAAAGGEFCLADDGRPFTIRYARMSRGDVNTAFPDASRGDAR